MIVSRLTLQRLNTPRDRVLALAQLVALGDPDDSFSASEVAQLAEQLRLPPVGDVSREISRLRASQHVVRLSTGRWSVTPEGEQLLLDLVGTMTPELSDAAGASVGAELGRLKHQVIPAPLAPRTLGPPIARLLEEHPFEQNVLLITRFPAVEADPLSAVIRTAKDTCKQHGLHLHVAGDRNADPLLFNNVAGYMWACRFGLALFEAHGDPPRKPAELNQNLLIEVGGMLMTGRRCAILRDLSVAEMPIDLVGHIFHPIDLSNLDTTTAQLHRALVADFATSRCPDCPKT